VVTLIDVTDVDESKGYIADVYATNVLSLNRFNMTDFEKELEQMALEEADKKEVPLPTIEEQKAVVAKLKELEAQGELTPEVLEAHFGQFYIDNGQPIH
jgi:hypothetical protein